MRMKDSHEAYANLVADYTTLNSIDAKDTMITQPKELHTMQIWRRRYTGTKNTYVYMLRALHTCLHLRHAAFLHSANPTQSTEQHTQPYCWQRSPCNRSSCSYRLQVSCCCAHPTCPPRLLTASTTK
eukprot:GHUV01005787.1.p1 GENE.GHUV01005787.1~~GHUV01005787.1.p1  ORF type:complete len:127 (-),score=17.19 GHUV01005787.1:370-750(-)